MLLISSSLNNNTIKDNNMASYNTSGVTSYDPRNLGGSEGYGPSKPSSNGLASKPKVSKMDSDMYAGSKYSPTSGAGTSKAKQTYSSAAAATANDDNVSYGQSYSPNVMSAAFTSAGAVLPPPAVSKPLTFRDYTGGSLYDSDIFKPKILPDNSSDINNFLGRSAIDDALREALGPSKMPEIYLGQSAEEPEPNIDMSVLQGALQPEPITVEEIEVKAGDTLTGIAAANNVPVQDVIDANPQIKNPDLIRPGEKVTLPSIISTMGKLLKTATDPEAPAPVSEDPDREFYQSGMPIEERVFEGEDPRNLGGAEGYGSVGTPSDAETSEGLMTRPKARPDKLTITKLGKDWDNKNSEDVKILQSVLSNIGGAIPPKVGSIDGAWGKKGRNALWAFQVRAGITPTGEMNEETAAALNAPDTLDPRKTKGSAPVTRKDIKQLVAAEDFRVMPYELNSSRSGRSGLTIGAGIDVGQRTAQELKDDFGFTDAMIEEFGVYDAATNPTGWIGRNPADPSKGGQGGAPGTAARNRVHAEMAAEYERQRLAGELPVIDESWLVDNMADVYDEYVPAVKEAYEEAYGDGSWDALPAEVQAMPVLETYRGDPINNGMLLAMSEGRYFDAANLAVKSSRKNSYKKVLRAEGHTP
jgi:LysM repeat protein